MTNMAVAHTILEQLGGGRFLAMTGAKNLLGDEHSLSFRLPGGGGFTHHGINYVKVKLQPSDTYDVSFKRIRGQRVTDVKTLTDIYADQLREVFTRETGLQTSLGSIPAIEMRRFHNRHED